MIKIYLIKNEIITYYEGWGLNGKHSNSRR